MEELISHINVLSIHFKVDIPYNKTLYKYLRESGKINQATGEERNRIIKKAKSSFLLESEFMAECKRIHLQEYFDKKLKII